MASCALLVVVPAAAQFSSGSSGVHGAFPPIPSGQTEIPSTATIVLLNVKTGLVRYCSYYDTLNRPETCTTELATAQLPGIPAGGLTTGVFEFTNFDFQPASGSGRDLYFVGNDINVPITILSQGDIRVACGGPYCAAMHAEGLRGHDEVKTSPGGACCDPTILGGVGGKGGPGGYAGGAAGNAGANGNAGFGPSGGAGGTVSTTSPEAFDGAVAGSSVASFNLTPVVGGSGGGGGAGSLSNTLCGTNGIGGWGGGGGGGGGGALLLAATNEISIGGTIYVRGGDGGSAGSSTPSASCALRGGGGEGGSIRLVAKTVSGPCCGSSILLAGGNSGGVPPRAPGGRIRIEAFTNTLSNISDATSGSFIPFPSPVTPPNMPVLRITSVGGLTVTNPTGSFVTPDVNFSSPPTNPVTVQLSASNIPVGTTIALRAVPLVGTPTTATSSALAGTLASSTASASINIPPGYGSLTASASFTASASSFPGRVLSSLPKIDGKAPERIEIVADTIESKLFAVAANGKRIAISPNGGWSFQGHY